MSGKQSLASIAWYNWGCVHTLFTVTVGPLSGSGRSGRTAEVRVIALSPNATSVLPEEDCDLLPLETAKQTGWGPARWSTPQKLFPRHLTGSREPSDAAKPSPRTQDLFEVEH